MAKRTRRDLSDKRVRKIIQKKVKAGSQSAGSYSHRQSFSNFKKALYLTIIAVVIVGGYFVIRSVNFSGMMADTPADEQQVQSRPAEEKSVPEPAPKNEPSAPADSAEEKTVVANPVPMKTQVEVLNGCGVAGIAMKTTKYLRKKGIDVVYMGNYEDFDVSNSQVLDRAGKAQASRKIGNILGIAAKYIKTDIDRSKQLDASIILGKDYKNLAPFKK